MDEPKARCLDEEIVAAYAEGGLPPSERPAAEAHLASCASCRSDVRARIATPGLVPPPAPAGMAERILERIPARTPPERRAGSSWKEGRVMVLRATLAAAAAALLASGLALWLAAPPPNAGGRPPEAGAPAPPPPPAGGQVAVIAVADPAKGKDLGSDRFLAHLSTDKPLYRPGERVRARAVLLDAFTRKPGSHVHTQFEVRSPKGEVLFQQADDAGAADPKAGFESAVAAFGWEIPADGAGGAYTLAAKFPGAGFPDAEATFDVRDYRVPRLKTDLQFLKKAYGPGDEVQAALKAERAEGGIPSGAKATAVATVDGKEVHRQALSLDAKGTCSVSFKLPAEIAAGAGTLALAIEDGGVQETAAKTIPIVLAKVDVSFFPEGGDLVAGVENRIYFEARTPRQDPADIAGTVVDGDGREVARLASVHEGRGRFAFTPKAGASYRVILEKPAGVKEPLPLPAPREAGFALAAAGEIVEAGKAVRVHVASPVTTGATVGLFLRERELARKTVGLPAGSPVEVSLAPGSPADGVLRVTVFDAEGNPRAERLVFRRPERSLRIEVSAAPGKSIPAGGVKVTVRTTDDSGRPLPAVLGIAAVDDAVLETIDKRERAPRLPVQALLGSEVKELKDAHAYLAGGPEAAERTDLLLGTQGWRRFAYARADEFVAASGMAGRRALAHRTPPPPPDDPRRAQGWDREMRGILGFDAIPAEAPPAPKMPAPEEPAKPAGKPDAKEGGEKAEIAVLNDLRGNRFRRDDADRPLLERLKREEDEAAQAGAAPPAWARVYAHDVRPDRKPGERSDFEETIYWNAALKTDEKGEATFAFKLSDSVTTFRVRADGFSAEGALGEADSAVESRRPFYIEPKFPLEVTAGDRIDLPVTLANGTDAEIEASLAAELGEGLKLAKGAPASIRIPGNGSVRTVLPVEVKPHKGPVKIRLSGEAGGFSDDVTREIAVVPAGFPLEIAFGGVLSGSVVHAISMPADAEPASVRAEAAAYPTPLASMTEAVAALLQEPSGCFEQTSSSNYPNVMAMQYMKGHAGVDAALVAKAQGLLDQGYRKLVSFECKQKGYEWFGGDPGHESLTAYGLMEFLDMAEVMPVDPAMVARTRAWLLARRDGKGGFSRNPQALDSFGGAPEDVTNAYIVWALTQAREKGIDQELAALKALAGKSEDPYILALAGSAMWNAGDPVAGESVLARLAKKQDKDGRVPGASTSITRSGGEGLDIETTSLAALGWMRFPARAANAEKAIRWIAERCKAGRFGSTQSTILALKAIVSYDALRARPKSAGKLLVSVDGRKAGEIAFPADQQGPIQLPDFGEVLTDPGEHKVQLTLDGGGEMPYSLVVRLHAKTPASSRDAKVSIETSLSRADAPEGEPVDLPVTVKNLTKEGQPMTVAIVGLPGGLEARADQLKELVKAGLADAFETRGREVILYWRALAPLAEKRLRISCLAAVPGAYEGPASRAYLYYSDGDKAWVPGLKASVAAR